MATRKGPFRADHVGSLIRPDRLLEARAKRKSGEITQDALTKLEDELVAIEADCEKEIEKLKAAMDPMRESLQPVRLTPLKKDCSAKSVGIVWLPYRTQSQPTTSAAW